MKKLILSQGFYALVDDADFELLSKYKWNVFRDSRRSKNIYAVRGVGVNGVYKSIRMHRELLGITDPKIQIDHKDGNGLNNQRSNLRVCTQAQNLANRSLNKNSTSGYKGVYWDKRRSIWRAHIRFNGKLKVIGYHENKDVAAKMYNDEAVKTFGDFSRLNAIQWQ